jgi:hypothetical protein
VVNVPAAADGPEEETLGLREEEDTSLWGLANVVLRLLEEAEAAFPLFMAVGCWIW